MPYYCQLFTERIIKYRPHVEVLDTKKLANFQKLEEYTVGINLGTLAVPKTRDAHLIVASHYQLSRQEPSLLVGFRIMHILTSSHCNVRYQLECFRLLDSRPQHG